MHSHSPLPIRLLTHNIRYATSSPFLGEEPWPIRLPRLLSELRYNTAHHPTAFICLQEVLHNQLHEILTSLNGSSSNSHQLSSLPSSPSLTASSAQWSHIGVGRDDGATAGEYSPILYQAAEWDLQSWTTHWLSPTPHKPSKGWDAASIRIVTTGKFRHRASRKVVVVMSTHLDDQGVVSRWEGARVIGQVVKEYVRAGGSGDDEEEEEGEGRRELPVVLGGDLNSEPVADDAYGVITEEEGFIDCWEEAGTEDGSRRYGHKDTFTGFGHEEGTKRIDFVFARKGRREGGGEKSKSKEGVRDNEMVGKGWETGKMIGRWRLEGVAVLENRFEDGVYNSDHRAVVADLLLH